MLTILLGRFFLVQSSLTLHAHWGPKQQFTRVIYTLPSKVIGVLSLPLRPVLLKRDKFAYPFDLGQGIPTFVSCVQNPSKSFRLVFLNFRTLLLMSYETILVKNWILLTLIAILTFVAVRKTQDIFY